jgi:tetratricopeptide (TPR) repeat protein
VLLLATPVLADEVAPDEAAERAPQPTPEQDQRARELYRMGDELYAQGQYEEALAAFEEAYELSGRTLLLFNVANAQERAGHWEDAVVTLRTYLATVEGDERGRIESRIESLEGRIERIRSMQQNPNEVAPAPPPEPPGVGPGGPILLGASALLVGAGIALAVVAGNARDDLDGLCRNGDGGTYCPSSASDALGRDKAFSITADVLFLAATGALVAGIVLLVRGGADPSSVEPEADDEDGAEVGIDVAASPRGALVGLHGTF